MTVSTFHSRLKDTGVEKCYVCDLTVEKTHSESVCIKKKSLLKNYSVPKSEFKLTDSELPIFTNVGFKDLLPEPMVEML